MPGLSAVTLPRPLVLHLLHHAQTADGEIRGVILRQRDGSLVLRMGDAAGLPEGATPFALFRSMSTDTPPPPREPADRHQTAPLLLQVVLGTRGVLQLRGWDVSGDEATPVQISFAEEPETA